MLNLIYKQYVTPFIYRQHVTIWRALKNATNPAPKGKEVMTGFVDLVSAASTWRRCKIREEKEKSWGMGLPFVHGWTFFT